MTVTFLSKRAGRPATGTDTLAQLAPRNLPYSPRSGPQRSEDARSGRRGSAVLNEYRKVVTAIRVVEVRAALPRGQTSSTCLT
jgi:hypothetical protein